jgi:hypothetical protein
MERGLNDMEDFLIGLGYGGDLESMARFEWDFRCLLGLRDPLDEQAKEAFIQQFVASTSPDEPIVLLLDEFDNPMFRAFMEYGKHAISKYEGLYVFLVAEDQRQEPHIQYLLNIEPDPIGEQLMPNQMMLDSEGVPDEVFRFLQTLLNVQFYRREGEEDVMLEFRIQELPVI